MAHALKSEKVDSRDLKTLEDLNRAYVRAAETSDAGWYAENCADDFVATYNGTPMDRGALMQRVAKPYAGSNPHAVDVRIRCFNDLAVVHAAFRFNNPDGKPGSGRYTDLYQKRNGRWVCIAAHFNRF